VRDKEVAVNVGGGGQERRGPSLLQIFVFVRPDRTPAEVEKLVYEEIERLKTEPVADWELEKVRMQLKRQRAQQLQSTLFRSILIGQYAVFFNDPGLINTLEAKYDKVTKDDIQRVARTYLKDTNRTVITTVPKPQAASSTQAAQ